MNRRQFVSATATLGTGSIMLGTASGKQLNPGDGIWQFKTGDYVASSPTVIGKTVYIGSNDGNLYALDAETGDRRWTFETDMWIRSSPEVVDGTVFVGNDDGILYAINAETGQKIWQRDIGINRLSSPTVFDGIVYATGNGLYALDVSSGSEVWHSDRGHSQYSPLVADGTIFVTEVNSSSVCAIDADSGEVIWESEAKEPAETAPVLADGTVYVGTEDKDASDYYLCAINAEDGSTEWRFKKSGHSLDKPPTVAGNTAYIGTSYEENAEWKGALHAIDTATGTEQWRFNAEQTNIMSSPTVARDTVYFGYTGVHALDANDGTKKWESEMAYSVRSAPTIVDGVLYAGFDDYSIYAINTSVNGSSEDARVTQAVLGHHHSYVEASPQEIDPVVSYSPATTGDSSESHPDGSDGTTSRTQQSDTTQREPGNSTGAPMLFFSQAKNLTTNPVVLAGGSLATIGAGYLGYQLATSSDSDNNANGSRSNPRNPRKETAVNSRISPTLDINGYDDINIEDSIISTDGIEILSASAENTTVWVIQPSRKKTETLTNDQIDQISEHIRLWAEMDAHPDLLTVHAHGREPLPWAAVEPATSASLSDRVDEFTETQVIKTIIKSCDAVHHVQRYGGAYEALTPESILVDDDMRVTLRGILDQLVPRRDPYQLPTATESPKTEQADIYRLGATTYEALTGSPPSHSHSTPSVNSDAGIEEVIQKALDSNPSERFDTVIHFRDALNEHL